MIPADIFFLTSQYMIDQDALTLFSTNKSLYKCQSKYIYKKPIPYHYLPRLIGKPYRIVFVHQFYEEIVLPKSVKFFFDKTNTICQPWFINQFPNVNFSSQHEENDHLKMLNFATAYGTFLTKTGQGLCFPNDPTPKYTPSDSEFLQAHIDFGNFLATTKI